MSLGFRRKIPDQKDDDQAPDDRREENKIAPGARRIEQVGVEKERPASEIGQVVNETDQSPEHGGSHAGEHPDAQGEETEKPELDLGAGGARRTPGVQDAETGKNFRARFITTPVSGDETQA